MTQFSLYLFPVFHKGFFCELFKLSDQVGLELSLIIRSVLQFGSIFLEIIQFPRACATTSTYLAVDPTSAVTILRHQLPVSSTHRPIPFVLQINRLAILGHFTKDIAQKAFGV